MMELTAAQVVVENGTMPVDDVFPGLAARLLNHGITDIDRLLAREPQLDAAAAGRRLRAPSHRRRRHEPRRAQRDLRCAAARERALREFLR